MSEQHSNLYQIKDALARFGHQSLSAAALQLFAALGYRSDKRGDLRPNTAATLLATFPSGAFSPNDALIQEWRSVDLLFQLADDDLRNATQLGLQFDSSVDPANPQSYIVFAVELTQEQYTRTQLAGITREINKLLLMPIMVLFKHGATLTLAVINRRRNKQNADKDVLEKVTLIKDIVYANPHRAHLQILYDLSLAELARQGTLANFAALHAAWQATLDSTELNKRFYREVADWFFWASSHVTFPAGAGDDEEVRNKTSLIRLLTRLMFVWFLKERELVPDALFNRERVTALLNDLAPDSSSYYKAILQNLFFATLNTPMNDPAVPRKFRGTNKAGGLDNNYMAHNLYRYEKLFNDPQAALDLFRNVPFLNGGLFECLDKRIDSDGATVDVRVDGFSDRPDNPLRVPNTLFFGPEQTVDLSSVYGSRAQRKVRGLIDILSRYKFTITENTPIEEEVALDPELLGRVFENLLAAYNPETGTTARKQTGSFYTPREIVNYMVDESLVAYLSAALAPTPNPFPTPARAFARWGEGNSFLISTSDTRSNAASTDGERNGVLTRTLGARSNTASTGGEGNDDAAQKHHPVPPSPSHGGRAGDGGVLAGNEGGSTGDGDMFVGDGGEFAGDGDKVPDIDTRLRHLVAYNNEPHGFSRSAVARLIEAIDNCKILDPACGSGAFPMGVLQKLVHVLHKLDRHNGQWKERQIAKVDAAIRAAEAIDDSDRREQSIAGLEDQKHEIEIAFERNELDYGRKLFLIENCIYGVDIQPIAVQIAKLRCFIALIVDQRINDEYPNRNVRSLPNLETKFVAANTLIGLPVQQTLRSDEVVQKEHELADVRRKHFTARTPKTKEAYRKRDQKLRAEISALLRAEGVSLETANQLAAWNPYDQNAYAPFFDPEWMFGVDGFDIVIGNPPYVRQEQISALKPLLQQQYTCYTGAADLYVYFYERGVQLLHSGGTLSYISSNKYFRAGYGEKLRRYLATNTTIQHVIDFGDAPVFTAIAYPSIITARNVPPSPSLPPQVGKGAEGSARNMDTARFPSSHRAEVSAGVGKGAGVRGHHVRALTWQPGPPIEEFAQIFAANSFEMPQKELTADGWRLEDQTTLRLLDKLRAAGTPLGKYVNGRFYRGILTGFNEAFVVDRATRDRLIAEDASSAELLKPFLRGRDVKRWRVQPQDLWLIFTRRGIDITKYPAIHKHLSQYKDQLMPGVPGGRKPGSYKWYEIQDNIAYWQAFEEPKIAYPNICKRNEFAWDEDHYYTNQKAFIIPGASKYLLAVLNSTVVMWLFTKLLSKLQNDFYEPSSIFIKDFPIANATPAQQAPIIALVERILAAKKDDPKADAHAWEREIDALVYQLYGLNDDEIAVVAPSPLTPLPQGERGME